MILSNESRSTASTADVMKQKRKAQISLPAHQHIGKILTPNQDPGFIGAMRTKTFGVILAVCFLSAGACFADAHKGTWKLDAAKSKLGKGTGRNNVVNYEYEFPGLRTKVLIDGVDASGHAFHSAWEGRFDGQERPVMGDSTSDSRS